MTDDYRQRTDQETLRERTFLARRVAEIERSMGRVAGLQQTPTPFSQGLDAVDRARELTSDMQKQVHVRTLEEAVTAQLGWLDRAEQRRQVDDGEPKPDLNRIALDRRILTDLLRAWRAEGN